jgi:prophage antirepressor-like protein
MSDLELFTYEHTDIRTVDIDGKRWAVANDICAALDIKNARDAVTRLDEADVATTDIRSGGQMRKMWIVSEDGATDLVLDSRKPEARRFRRFLTHEVWPSIRDTGTYSATPALTDDELIHRALTVSAQRVAALTERVAELEPPAAAWTELAEAAGDYSVADAAKVLSRDPNITTGERRLFEQMHGYHWIYKPRGQRWRAYQDQVECGRLVEKINKPYWHEGRGELVTPEPTIRVTPKGLAELHKRLGGSGQLALMASA